MLKLLKPIVLILDIGYHLGLFKTIYVPSISRYLVSLSSLGLAGYTFNLKMDVSICLVIIISLVLEFFVIVYTNSSLITSLLL